MSNPIIKLVEGDITVGEKYRITDVASCLHYDILVISIQHHQSGLANYECLVLSSNSDNINILNKTFNLVFSTGSVFWSPFIDEPASDDIYESLIHLLKSESK